MGRPPNRDERRAQIADALIEVIGTRGYAGASTALIARHAGLSPGLVHYHFSNKREILDLAIERFAERYRARLDAAIERTEPGLGRVDALIAAHLDTRNADPELLRTWVQISSEAARDREVAAANGSLVQLGVSAFQEALAPLMDTSHAYEAAAALAGAIQGFLVSAASAPDVVPPGSAERLVRWMARGLVAQGEL